MRPCALSGGYEPSDRQWPALRPLRSSIPSSIVRIAQTSNLSLDAFLVEHQVVDVCGRDDDALRSRQTLSLARGRRAPVPDAVEDVRGVPGDHGRTLLE